MVYKKSRPPNTTDIKNRIYGYMRVAIKDKRQCLYVINGMPDHIHLLVSLPPTICVSDFIKDVKAASTKWIHKELGLKQFSWQEGYGAYTVGYSTEKSVIRYIENQEKHHEKMTFEEEYIMLLKMQDIDFDERFVLG